VGHHRILQLPHFPALMLLFAFRNAFFEHAPSNACFPNIFHVYNLSNYQILYRNSIIKLLGAGEARRAHNPEDVGSKPTAAIRFFFAFLVCFACLPMLQLFLALRMYISFSLCLLYLRVFRFYFKGWSLLFQCVSGGWTDLQGVRVLHLSMRMCIRFL
jgi:hypothetical protein